MRQKSLEEAYRLLPGPVAGHRHEERADLMRIEIEMIGRAVGGEPRRRRIEMQRRGPCLAVEPFIVERDILRPEQLGRTDAAARPLLAAHFEQIGKVAVEQYR